jgi:pilin isopeptide linkage protein
MSKIKKLLAVILAAALFFTATGIVEPLSVYAGDVSSLEFSVLDTDGYSLAADGSSDLSLSDFRDKSGTVRISVTVNSARTGNTVTLTLPSWFSWYRAQDGSGYTVSTSSASTSTGQGENNVLTVSFADLTDIDERTFSIDFNFRLNSSVMTGDLVTSLENGGLTDMTFLASLTNSAETENADDITAGYEFSSPAEPTVTNLVLGPIGNLASESTKDPVKTGIYDQLNQNTNVLSKVSIPATDPFEYGAAVDSIVISLDENVRSIYKINGFTTASDDSEITVFDNYNAVVSADGNTLTLTPKSADVSVDLDNLSEDRLLGAVDIGFRLADGSVYDRDTWVSNLGTGIFVSGSSSDFLHVNVNYKPFTTQETVGTADVTMSKTSTATMYPYERTTPEVNQTSADTSTYLTNQIQYGDDPIIVAAVVDEAGAADQTVWIGESLNNLVSTEDSVISIPEDASGYTLVTEYPYELRGTEYQIRPRYLADSSTLADAFSPGGFELEKVVFALSNGTSVEVSAENSDFADDWNTAYSSNGVMTVTAEQLGAATTFDETNESSVVYVTGVTQYYKTASPSIITDTSNYWSLRLTKWSVTTYEEDGTTVLGAGSLTHADGTVEENGKRWYPIVSTLYDTAGAEAASAEHDIQIRQLKCPELEFKHSSDSTSNNVYNSSWRLQSDNEIGKYLNVRIAKDTDLNSVQTHLVNPTIMFYHYWMDNIYTWTGEMDVSPAMKGWTITYGVTTYKRASEGLSPEVRTYTITDADFANANEDGTATIDLLPNTDGTETGDDWEYFAYSSEVGVGTDGFDRAEPAYISFHYDGTFDVTQVTDEDGDGIIETDNDGILIKNIEASSRTQDPDGQYSYYLWWDGGHVIKMCYQWDNCQDNDAAHLSTAQSSSGTGNWGHALTGVVEQLGAQLITPTSMSTQWDGTLVQGETTTISGSLTMTADVAGMTSDGNIASEWQPTGDVLYLEFPDTKLEFAGNATIDGVVDPDAYVTTINGTRYLVIHDCSAEGTVKDYTTNSSSHTGDWYGWANVTYDALEVSFDVFTMPTASTTSATTVVGDNSYLDFSAHQEYDNVSNNPDGDTYRTAIQKKALLNWNGARDGLGNGAAQDNPLGVHTKNYVNDRFWAMKTSGTSITAALNTNLGLVTFSGINTSETDDSDSLISVTGTQTVYPDQRDQMESLISLGAGENGLSNAVITVQIPQADTTVSDSNGSYTSTAGAVMRGAAKQVGTTSSENTLTFSVSSDGVNYETMTDTTDWASVKYLRAEIGSLDANEVVSFTLPLASEDAESGDEIYIQATAAYTEDGSEVTPRSVSGYQFKDYNISGTAWVDDDSDGILDPEETERKAGVSVTASDSSGNLLGQTVTADDGTWSLDVTGSEEISLAVSPRNALTIYTAGTTDNKFDPSTAQYALGTVSGNVTGIDIGYIDEPDPSDPLTISGTKTLTQSGETVTIEEGMFQASIRADSENNTDGYNSFQAGAVDIASDGTFSFRPIVFTSEGTYTFYVTEVDGNDGLYAYDSSEYTITVTVTRDENDKLITSETIQKDGVETDAITFANTKASAVTSDSLSVEKAISGDTPDSDSVFTFALTADSADSTLPDGMSSMPMPGGESDQQVTETVTGAGTVSFAGISFEEPGIYVYQLTEKNSGEPGYTYDTTSYTVTYTVTASDGTLTVSRTVEKAGQSGNTSAIFTNSYTTPTPDTGVISGSKTLTQNGQALPITEGQFKVDIEADSGNDESGYSGFTEGTYDVAANGSFTTQEITFNKAGTYSFHVTEEDGGDARYTYDDSEYTVTFAATNDSNNQLTVQKTITDSDGTEYSEIIFNNTKISEQEITVSKKWIGPRGTSASIHLLADGEEADSRVLSSGNSWTYTFLADPIDADGNDIVYTVVEDDVQNYTSAVSGDEENGFTVTNTYNGLTVSDPPVKKEISGDTPDQECEFVFTLTAVPDESTLPDSVSSDSMPMPESAAGQQTMEVSITGEGETEFGDITFIYGGTYVYRIAEKNTGETGYTYDGSVYTVKYEVSEISGGLTCVRTISKNGEIIESSDITNNQDQNSTALTFVNQYQKQNATETEEETSKPSETNNTSTETTNVTTSSEESSETTSVNTGDRMNIISYLMILVVSASLIVLLLVMREKRKDI